MTKDVANPFSETIAQPDVHMEPTFATPIVVQNGSSDVLLLQMIFLKNTKN